METSSPRNRRLWIPFILFIAFSGLFIWTRQSEHMMGTAILFLGAILGLVLTWIWWTFLSGLRSASRWLSLVGGIAIIGFLAASLRNEGSTSGSGVPRLVWKWAPTVDQISQDSLSQTPEIVPDTSSEAAQAPLRFLAIDSAEYYGGNRNGVIDGIQIQTDALDKPLETIWRQPIGLGWSSFAVKGRIAITQEQRGDEEWVTAYDLETGQLNWHFAKNRRFSEAMGGDGPRATPSIHGDTVYALGATGMLDALRLEDGTPIWSYNVLAGGKSNLVWGKSASPLYLEEENLVIVTGGNKGGPTVRAVSAEYGEAVWSWGTDAASYASPIEATIHGERQLVIVNENTIVGLAPESGELLWSHDWPRGMMASSAKAAQPSVIDGSKIFVSASYGVGSLLFDVTKGEDGSFDTTLVWYSKNRMKTKFSTATVNGKYAYGLDEGFFACINIETGKRIWKDGRYGFGQNLMVNDTAIIQAEDGDIVFVEANPEEFKEIARFPGVEGITWNIPTLAGEYLLVRNDKEAACYRVPATLIKSTP
jgi:outer membrane protein assembly factor BamB